MAIDACRWSGRAERLSLPARSVIEPIAAGESGVGLSRWRAGSRGKTQVRTACPAASDRRDLREKPCLVSAAPDPKRSGCRDWM